MAGRALLQRLRASAGRDAIPLADVGALAAQARRTRLVRLGLAGALVVLTLAGFLAVPSAEGRRFLPSGDVGIVVLDLSSSVQPKTYDLIYNQLRLLDRTDQRFSFVVFSDVAYEALPPGTPAEELKSFERFFDNRIPLPRDPDGNPLPRSPWEQWFSGGTNISAGLLLAADLLEREHVRRGGVVLISDLADDPSDLTRLANALVLYQQRRIPLRVVALDPAPENAEFWRHSLGDPDALLNVELPRGQAGRGTLAVEAPFPTWLAVLGVLVVALLAVNEWWAEPLRWAPRREASA
jgi:hypothetical protein